MSPSPRKFQAGVFFLTEESGRISFPEFANPDEAARVHLAMISLGKAFTDLGSLQERGFKAAGRQWVAVAPNFKDISFPRISMFQDALSGYSSFPKSSAALAINLCSNVSTGTDYIFPLRHQPRIVVHTDTKEARRTAALIFAEAATQANLIQGWNQQAQDRYKDPAFVHPVEYPSQKASYFYKPDSGQILRIEIEYENGKSQKLRVDQLRGYQPTDNAEHWVLSKWKTAQDIKRWRLVTDHDNSKKKTSGWVVIADQVGDVYDHDDRKAQEIASTGKIATLFGPFLIFQSDNPQIAAAGSALHALRRDIDGSWNFSTVSENDVVINRDGQVLFRGDQNTLFGQVVEFGSPHRRIQSRQEIAGAIARQASRILFSL